MPSTREVVLYQLLSLDGVAEEPGDWMSDRGAELIENLGEIIQAQDDVLLGRGTYEYWVDFWPTAEIEPFASFINTTPKHVFTSTPGEPAWSNTTFVTDRAEDHVAALKQGDGGDIGIHGSITLAQSLLRAGLVDELRLVVASVTAGSGRRLFLDDGDLQAWALADVRRSAAGTLFLRYTSVTASAT